MSEPTAAENEATGETVKAELCGHMLAVPPTNKWRSSAMRALRNGDTETWAERTLSEEDYATWCEVDPTMEEVDTFFGNARDGLGVSVGNSRASRRS